MNNKCPGCGVQLTNDKQICDRCFKLKHYGVYEPTTKTNDDYQHIINNINKNSLIIYVTSLLNINIQNISKFSNVILVLTKKDLLPKSVQDYKLENYIHRNYPQFLKVEVISSLTNYNLDNLYKTITKYHTNPTYVIGYTNSGKSTLINKLIKNYTDKQDTITTSPYPSTTLDTITININSAFQIIDTPGIISPTSIINYIDSNMLKKITPKKTIKPRTYQIKESGSLLIENILRLDYSTNESSMTIYISNAINILRINTNNPQKKDEQKHTIHINDNEDLVIEDLCFIKFTNHTKLNIYTDYSIGLTTRPNLI